MADEQEKRFEIIKLYVKDISFESPNTPDMFRQDWQPAVNVDLNTTESSLGDNVYEVVLTVTGTAKINDQTAFHVEVQQAGLFSATGFTAEEMGPLLGSFAPGTLFPFAREVIADLVTKGGFPPLILSPVNFDMIYAQKLQQQQAAGNA